MLFREINTLILKDLRLEFRQRSALNSILLYIVSTLFICYLAFSSVPNQEVWKALFWVIMLFACTNAVSKSFSQENKSRNAYYNSLVSQNAIIAAKLIYNALLTVVLALLFFLLFAFWMGNPIKFHLAFMITLVLGAIGFSSLMTFVSAISSRTGNQFALTAILGFPLSVPLIIICIDLTQSCMDPLAAYGFIKLLLLLGLLDAVIIALALILFPFLWRE
jgi:heme exporter protein B